MRHYVRIILKSGTAVNVTCSSEDAAISLHKEITDLIAKGFTGVSRISSEQTNAPHTILRVSDISAIERWRENVEKTEEKRREKEYRMRILAAQASYYEALARGESWKNNEDWHGD